VRVNVGDDPHACLVETALSGLSISLEVACKTTYT
jgi:hypothetical protein